MELDANRILEILLHLFYFGLGFMALIYFLERTIPFDGAFYSFKILNYGTFNIENERWGACYNQVLPLIGVKLGLSLPAILKLYSLSFVLCNYVFFLIIYYRFKQTYTAIAFTLVQVVAFRYNFFYQVSEIHSIIGPVFLLVASFLSVKFTEEKKWLGAIIVLILIFWLLNIHLLSIVIVAFCLAFCVLHNQKLLKNWPMLISVLMGVIYFVFKLKAVPADSYQSQKLVSFENISYVFTNLNDILGYKYFLKAVGNNYVLPVSLLIFMALFYLYKKMILKFLLLVISVLGFWVLIMAGEIHEEAPIVCENYYALFGYFIAIPFSIDFLQNIKLNWSFPVLLWILLFSITKIATCGTLIHDQIDFFKRTTDNLRAFPEKKFAMSYKNVDWDGLWVAWDFPFQSLIVSSLASPDSAITFYATDDSSKYTPQIYSDTSTLVGVPWSPFWFASTTLPSNYFRLKNTLYRNMNTLQDSSFHPEKFTAQNMDLSLFDQSYCFWHDQNAKISVSISNKSTELFYSRLAMKQQSYLGFRVYNIHDYSLVKEGRTLLDLDIYPNHTLVTSLIIPKRFLKKGCYTVEVDMVDEYKRWYGMVKKFNLVML